MKEPRELKQARQRFVSKAVKGALRDHFTGEGSAQRIMSFLARGILKSCACLMGFLVLASWAIVGGLTLGPDHTVFLAEVYAWVQSTPFDVVSSTIQARTHELLIEGAKVGLISGFAWQLVSIVKPASDNAHAVFNSGYLIADPYADQPFPLKSNTTPEA